MKVRVFRYDPAKDKEPHYSSRIVAKREKTSLLNVLEEVYLHQDPSLTFSYLCGTGKCGGCVVPLNGTPVLTCRCVIGDRENVLLVEPIENLPAKKDFLVNRERFDRRVQEAVVGTTRPHTFASQPDTLYFAGSSSGR